MDGWTDGNFLAWFAVLFCFLSLEVYSIDFSPFHTCAYFVLLDFTAEFEKEKKKKTAEE